MHHTSQLSRWRLEPAVGGFFITFGIFSSHDSFPCLGLSYCGAPLSSSPARRSCCVAMMCLQVAYVMILYSLGCTSVCVQVFVICKEALADSPSCKPALDTLTQYYYCLAAAASEQRAYEQAAAAAAHALKVLEAASVADPMKGMYWKHRRQCLQQMLARLPPTSAAAG